MWGEQSAAGSHGYNLHPNLCCDNESRNHLLHSATGSSHTFALTQTHMWTRGSSSSSKGCLEPQVQAQPFILFGNRICFTLGPLNPTETTSDLNSARSVAGSGGAEHTHTHTHYESHGAFLTLFCSCRLHLPTRQVSNFLVC